MDQAMTSSSKSNIEGEIDISPLLLAFVFGSRTKGTAKKFSDLDLLIKDPIDSCALIHLKNEFEESTILYKVDVVLWDKIDDNFRSIIKDDLLLF